MAVEAVVAGLSIPFCARAQLHRSLNRNGYIQIDLNQRVIICEATEVLDRIRNID